MITCHLRYVIDPYKLKEFERYSRMWIPLIQKFGGTCHGCFLPSEGANNIAVTLFSFPSLADYEQQLEEEMAAAQPVAADAEPGPTAH